MILCLLMSISSLLSSFQIIMTNTLSRRKATVDKFIPSSIMRKISRRCRQSLLSSQIKIDRSLSNSRRCKQSRLHLAQQPLIPHKSCRHHLGPCDIECSSCGALHWIQERSYQSTIENLLFFTCCQRGKFILPSFSDAPEPLRSLLRDQTEGIC